MNTQKLLVADLGGCNFKYNGVAAGWDVAELAADIAKCRLCLDGKAIRLKSVEIFDIHNEKNRKSKKNKHH